MVPLFRISQDFVQNRLVAVVVILFMDTEHDFHRIIRHPAVHPVHCRFHSDAGSRILRVTEDPGGDARKYNAVQVILRSQIQGIPVAVRQQFGVLFTAGIDRADRMDDFLCRQAEPVRDFRFSGATFRGSER